MAVFEGVEAEFTLPAPLLLHRGQDREAQVLRVVECEEVEDLAMTQARAAGHSDHLLACVIHEQNGAVRRDHRDEFRTVLDDGHQATPLAFDFESIGDVAADDHRAGAAFRGVEARRSDVHPAPLAGRVRHSNDEVVRADTGPVAVVPTIMAWRSGAADGHRERMAHQLVNVRGHVDGIPRFVEFEDHVARALRDRVESLLDQGSGGLGVLLLGDVPTRSIPVQ